jgi:adenylate cyclase
VLERASSLRSPSTRPPASTSRPLTGLDAGPDTRYLNYYGPPGTIRTISYHTLIGDYPGTDPEGPADLSGAYVFVGYAELQGPSKTDTFVSVFPGRDGVEMSGVEIAATAFANLISDRTLKRSGPVITVAILLGIGMLAAVVTCSMPATVGTATAFGLALAYAGAAYLAFARYDLWLPLAIPIVVELPLTVVLGLFTQYLRARTQRQAMQDVVSYYVPERVAHEMADHAIHPLSVHETTFATCLAMDAENFTALSETLPPDSMAAFLNEYFAAVAEPLTRYGVDFKEFHADSVMCAWMANGSDVLVRTRACRAALETLKAVNDFNVQRAPLHLGVRLGLHAGPVFVGNVGAGGQFSFRILGNIVNTACRVEGLNKFVATRLLATRDVIADVEGLLLRPLGDFQLKGKQTAVSIFEIVAGVEQASDEQRALCERFVAALDAFQTRHREDAAALFAAILCDYPGDGPTRFYVKQCQSSQDADMTGGTAQA